MHDGAPDVLIRVIDVLGDFHLAVFPNGQDAVVVEERLGAGFVLRFDHVLKEHGILEFDRPAEGVSYVGNGNGALNSAIQPDAVFTSPGLVPARYKPKEKCGGNMDRGVLHLHDGPHLSQD